MQVFRYVPIVCVAYVLSTGTSLAQGGPLPAGTPESVGFSAERLRRLDDALKAFVDDKQLAGMVTMMARHGKVVSERIYGQRDMAGAKPMDRDTIFRIYSMTKPITGVAMMMLYEEGKWKPGDPIAKHIPELADLKVYAGTDANGDPRLEAPAHAPTVGELMTHTAGFTYGYFGNTPVDNLYRASNPLQAASLPEMIQRLARLPLLYQPGEAWAYSVSVDVQGYLVEKLSGKPFADFVRDRILVPLGMKDTGFFVPQEKLARLATVYTPDPKGSGLTAVPHDPGVSRPPGLTSGGAGMYSTAGDYLRFAQMLLRGGEFDGVRLLSPATVQLMRSNHLSEQLRTGKFGIGTHMMNPGLGFGYDVAVFDDPVKAGSAAGKRSYFWDGLAGTWFWIDPANDIVFVGMVQRMSTAPGMPNLQDTSRALVYEALVDRSR